MSGTSFAFPFSSPFGSGFSFVPAPGGSPLSSLGLNAPGAMSTGVDRLIDPVTLDYVRTDNGEWAETDDSRTSFLIALSVSLGSSPFDPSHGTTIGERLRSGVGLTPDFLQAETVRVGNLLRSHGILSDLVVSVRDENDQVRRDDSGTPIVKVDWRDLISGSPASAIFTPR